ncbi:helix-turn-helix domain-containing protein [Streptomyces roseoverticillatus]|uniref:helix-turn-helix domain-containing protein n=1 Tax=Streptomyces roseoverticillatus TaxID=66429 RepID=UPI0009975255|nr:helix-turn-helix transcriptional regulator [Streptomyces roseoverticillatus]
MPRPEKPIDHTVPEVGALAAYLRAQRAASGRTYAELAAGALCSQATLKRAASGGVRPPDWEMVCQYVHLCGHGDIDEARFLYERAQDAAVTAARDARRTTVVPKPQFVRDLGDLSGALRDAYRRAGSPSVREMERHAGPGRLPHSTAHAIIRARTVPKYVLSYIAFLEACEITGRALIPWFAAWVKVYGVGRIPPVIIPATAGEELFILWVITTEQDRPVADEARAELASVSVVNGQQRLSSLRSFLKPDVGGMEVAA